MKTKNIKLYIVAEFIYLISIFTIAKLHLGNKLHSEKLYYGISIAFIGLYIIKYFFRPNYEDLVKLRAKGWKISGYYSKKALSNIEIYRDSYDFWVKSNLILLNAFFLLQIVLKQIGLIKANMYYVSIIIVCIIQVFTWLLTYNREKLNN